MRIKSYCTAHKGKHVDGSCAKTDKTAALIQAARHLVDAYTQGEKNGGHISWDDLDMAHRLAVAALDE